MEIANNYTSLKFPVHTDGRVNFPQFLSLNGGYHTSQYAVNINQEEQESNSWVHFHASCFLSVYIYTKFTQVHRRVYIRVRATAFRGRAIQGNNERQTMKDKYECIHSMNK